MKESKGTNKNAELDSTQDRFVDERNLFRRRYEVTFSSLLIKMCIRDSPIIRQELAKHGLKAHLNPNAAVKEDGAIAYVEDHEVIITEPIAFNMEQEALALTGQHNLYNSLASGISANLAGIAKENIRKALSDFKIKVYYRSTNIRINCHRGLLPLTIRISALRQIQYRLLSLIHI